MTIKVGDRMPDGQFMVMGTGGPEPLSTGDLLWQPTTRPGVEEKLLYSQAGFEDRTRLERWAPASGIGPLKFPDGAEIFVIDGDFEDDGRRYGRLSWLRLPPGSAGPPGRRRGRGAETLPRGEGFVR